VRRACDLGHGPACGVYGQILGDRATLGGEARGAAGAPRRRALDALRRACDLDFGDGCAELAADAQRHGDGALAKRLFSLGCTLGSQAACEGRAARRRDPQTLRRIADELLGDKPPARKRGGPS
jgi:TPR repeat protein